MNFAAGVSRHVRGRWEIAIDAGTRQVVSNGMRILLDKEGALRRLLNAVSQKIPSGSRPRKN